MIKRKIKAAIPDESLAPLGKVIANFAVSESNLDSAIWLLLVGNSSAEQRTGQIVTAELMFRNKIALLSSLYQHRFPTKTPFTALNEMRKKLNDANNKRNDLVHSTWLAGGKKVATTAQEKRGIKFDFKDMNASQIDGIADFISEVGAEMQEFYISFLK